MPCQSSMTLPYLVHSSTSEGGCAMAPHFFTLLVGGRRSRREHKGRKAEELMG
jgi:hypothetical protein